MYRWNNKEYKCPVEITIDVLGGKWRSLIVWHLSKDVLRFSEVQKIVPGISKKVLSEHLKELEKNKLIDRKVYPEITSKGKGLSEILDLMEKWGRNILETEGVKIG